jgi:NADH:ubiquinone oxidoreductase subunit C
VEKMRVYLQTAPNPYDANMELAMTGVQERFNGLSSQVTGVSAKMDGMETKIERIDAKIERIDARLERMESKFEAAARAFFTDRGDHTGHTYEREGNSGHTYENTIHTNIPGGLTRAEAIRHMTSPSQNRNIRLRTELPENVVARRPALVEASLSQQFASLSSMWDEWHGVGGRDTKDKPIPGGFEQLEQIHKSKWRSHLSHAQQRHATRIRLIINGIKTKATTSGISPESALDELEAEWTRRKKSPDAMVKHLQDLGYVKKSKPRGRHTRQGL